MAVLPTALAPATPPPLDWEDTDAFDRIARAATHMYLRPPALSAAGAGRLGASPRSQPHAMLRRLSAEHRLALDECRADQARMALLQAAEAEVRTYLRRAVMHAEARTAAEGSADAPPRRRRGQRRVRRVGGSDTDGAPEWQQISNATNQAMPASLLLRPSPAAPDAASARGFDDEVVSVCAGDDAGTAGVCGPQPGIAGMPTPAPADVDAAGRSFVPAAAARATLQAVCSFYCLRSWPFEEVSARQGSHRLGDTAGGPGELAVAACLPTAREGLDAATLAQRWLGIKAASQISLGEVLRRTS
jgi:hypothetical protein